MLRYRDPAVYLEHKRRYIAVLTLRRQGLTFKEIGRKIDRGPERVRGILAAAELELRRASTQWLRRRTRSRPIDMGGPRDIWLTDQAETI